MISGLSVFAGAIRRYVGCGFYPDRLRHRLLQDLDSKEYLIVGPPDWPAYEEGIERGDFRLIMALTGKELVGAYEGFTTIQGGLFDGIRGKKGLETGSFKGGDSAKLDVRATGYTGERPGENVAHAGQGNNDRATECGRESEAG
mgnify:CR=1 FL=1